MRFYARTTRNTGASVGCFGVIFLLPIYAVGVALVGLCALLYLVFQLVVWVVTVIVAIISGLHARKVSNHG